MRYRMTDEELGRLKEACKPVTYIVVGGVPPVSPRTKAMRVWADVARRVGCIRSTINLASTGDEHDFDATPKRKATP